MPMPATGSVEWGGGRGAGELPNNKTMMQVQDALIENYWAASRETRNAGS